MKELIEYNKSLLEVADQKLKRLIETEHDINHPGPYFDMVNKQLDYVNTLKERIKLINEKTNDNSKDISQKQWSNLVLEMKLIKKAWSSLCKVIELQGPGIKKIIALWY